MPMNNSRMTDDWIKSVVTANPIRIAENGNLITCPVRLAFVNLLKPTKGMDKDNPDKAETYNAVLLFPPGSADGINRLMGPMVHNLACTDFPKLIGPDGQPQGLHSPFHMQDEKTRFSGYTAGNVYITAGTQFKPQIVDAAMNPIVDEKRVYAGVWAICAVNVYSYGTKVFKGKRGVSFGLQSVMIFADDERIDGSGGSDPKADFAGVNIDGAYVPSAAFGAAAAPASILPAPKPVVAAPPSLQGLG